MHSRYISIPFINTDNDNQNNQDVNEVKEYLDCRYISSFEAAWRIFKYDIHYRYPAVEILPFHLEDGQNIVYQDDSDLCDILKNPTVKMTMFTEWLNTNKKDPFAKTLKYIDFPMFYTWQRTKKIWTRRQLKGYGSIGRINYVPPALGEIYYLRVLLNHVIGPTSYEDIRTVDDQVFETFKDACFARGLLDDDKEYINAIKEASTWASGNFLRTFFVMLLLSDSISRPFVLWTTTNDLLMEDILYQQRKIMNIPSKYTV